MHWPLEMVVMSNNNAWIMVSPLSSFLILTAHNSSTTQPYDKTEAVPY